jgi:hypothetical protein
MMSIKSEGKMKVEGRLLCLSRALPYDARYSTSEL